MAFERIRFVTVNDHKNILRFAMNTKTKQCFAHRIIGRRRQCRQHGFHVFCHWNATVLVILTLSVVLKLRGNVFRPRVLFESIEDFEFFLIVHDITGFVVVYTQQYWACYYQRIYSIVWWYCFFFARISSPLPPETQVLNQTFNMLLPPHRQTKTILFKEIQGFQYNFFLLDPFRHSENRLKNTSCHRGQYSSNTRGSVPIEYVHDAFQSKFVKPISAYKQKRDNNKKKKDRQGIRARNPSSLLARHVS